MHQYVSLVHHLILHCDCILFNDLLPLYRISTQCASWLQSHRFATPVFFHTMRKIILPNGRGVHSSRRRLLKNLPNEQHHIPSPLLPCLVLSRVLVLVTTDTKCLDLICNALKCIASYAVGKGIQSPSTILCRVRFTFLRGNCREPWYQVRQELSPD